MNYKNLKHLLTHWNLPVGAFRRASRGVGTRQLARQIFPIGKFQASNTQVRGTEKKRHRKSKNFSWLAKNMISSYLCSPKRQSMTTKKKSKYNKRKFLLTFCVTMTVLAVIRHAFVREEGRGKSEESLVQRSQSSITGKSIVKSEESDIDYADIDDTTSIEETTEDSSLFTFPSSLQSPSSLKETYDYTPEQERELLARLGQKGRDSIRLFLPEKYKPYKYVHSYSACFPDIQPVQIRAAIANGISPVRTREEALEYVNSMKLVNITNSPFYAVDPLTHSMPYLVPKAQELLNTICVNFIDSLIAHGMQPHLPIVTSVLRTAKDIKKLQRGNVNATTNSCHCYGTTVDITYNRFYPINGNYRMSRLQVARYNDRMKKMLAEVLLDLRMQGKCYVKYERKQACFHLTIR